MAIDVPTDKARAVVDAMEQDLVSSLTTKSDLAAAQTLLSHDTRAVRNDLKQDIDASRVAFRLELQLLQSSMTVRLGSIMVGLGLLFAALKLT